MKRLSCLLVGFVLSPYALAGVSIVPSSIVTLGPAGALAGVTSSKTFLLESGAPGLTSARAWVDGAGLRQGGDGQMATQVVASVNPIRDDGLPAVRGNVPDRQSVLVPASPDSSYESYAMMAAGVCAIGFLARRRKLV